MHFDEYQAQTDVFVIYPRTGGLNLIYPALELCGEAGEIAEKIKKLWRDKGQGMNHHPSDISPQDMEKIIYEMGDALYGLARLASELRVPLSVVAEMNIAKLLNRKRNDTISGSGDAR
jgi:NTP pyrophosphatase (non-canonical NTP hydrolase)